MARIMVVDDDVGIQILLEKVLKREKYEVTRALSGEEALEKIKVEKPDLVLLDVMMPGLNGWETLQKIREDEGTRDLPVIMVTVRAGEEDREKSFAARADGHVNKPILVDRLLATVKWVLENAQRRGIA